MALTQEQIYNLKEGDEIIVHGKCDTTYPDGDIRVNSYWTVAGEKREQSFLVHSSYVSLPPETPKYDPTRPFKKGDIVTPTEVNGRHPGNRGVIFRVCQDEAESGREIKLTLDGHIGHITIDAAYLQLVTPIEELEPYSIDPANTDILLKYGKKFATFEDDDAAQEVCDRLNAEWRKENANG